MAKEKLARTDEERLGPSVENRRKRLREIVRRSDLHRLKRDPQRPGRPLRVSHIVWAGSRRFHRRATRDAFDVASRRSSSRLPANSEAKAVIPVILAPGRARLATSPCFTASSVMHIMMGTLLVTR